MTPNPLSAYFPLCRHWINPAGTERLAETAVEIRNLKRGRASICHGVGERGAGYMCEVDDRPCDFTWFRLTKAKL